MRQQLWAVILSIAFVLAIWIAASSWKKAKQGKNTVNVTGLAQKDFVSDLIVWRGSFSKKSASMQEAYAALKKDAEVVRGYLKSKGVKDSEVVFSAVNINKEFETTTREDGSRTEVFTGYRLDQNVQIESKDVERIENISRGITELIDTGVEFYSNYPEYYYTKLAALKIEMLAEATKDARVRAEKIAENAGTSLGKLRNANMGIFQITAQNSSEDYSWGGTYNTAAKKKSASITVKLEFGLD